MLWCGIFDAKAFFPGSQLAFGEFISIGGSPIGGAWKLEAEFLFFAGFTGGHLSGEGIGSDGEQASKGLWGEVVSGSSHAICRHMWDDGGLFAASGEGEFGDAAFVEIAQAQCNHTVVLGFCRGGQREMEVFFGGQCEGDAAVFCGMGGGEEAGMVAMKHVFPVRCQNTGVGTCLGKNFEDCEEVEPESGGESEAFGEACGVDIHDHVDEGFELGGLPAFADVAEEFGFIRERHKNVLHVLEDFFFASDHEVEGAIESLCDAGGHAGFEGMGTSGFAAPFDFAVNGWGDRGAVDECFSGSTEEERVAIRPEEGELGGIVGDDCENDFCGGGDFSKGFRGGCADFRSEGFCGGAVGIENCGDRKIEGFETTGHVGSHASDTDKGDWFFHGSGEEGCEKRVGNFLFADGCERAVTRGEDGFIGQGEDFVAVGAEGVGIGNLSAAHRAREDCIAHDGEGFCKAVDEVGGAAAGVAPGESGFDAEAAEIEGFSGAEGVGTGQGRFAVADMGGCASFFLDAVEFEDVVAVCVGEEDEFEREFLGGEEVQHFGGVGTGIKCSGFAGRCIPDEVAVYGHVAKRRIESRESREGDCGGLVAVLSDGDEGGCVDGEDFGEGADDMGIELTIKDRLDFGFRNSGLCGDGGSGEGLAAQGLAENVGVEIFKWNGHANGDSPNPGFCKMVLRMRRRNALRGKGGKNWFELRGGILEGLSSMDTVLPQMKSSEDAALPPSVGDGLEVTILMPCLNEAETLAGCIEAARRGLDAAGVGDRAEILIADNGSTDGSQEIARAGGARVVDVPVRGYGSALRAGLEAARGRFVIMGDADLSYDFSKIGPFLEKLRAGADLVMGCRMPGGGGTILPGAMPWKHRWLGNPVLTTIGRLLFRCPSHDFHCGLRGLSKAAFEKMDLKTPGMEFASEMVIKASLREMRIEEVPITLHPDGRSRPPHLRSWRDGWRHLRFMLLFSPRWLLFYPGVVGMVLGGLFFLWLWRGAVQVGPVTFDLNTLEVSGMVFLFGYQMVLLACFARIFAHTRGLLPPNRLLAGAFSFFTLEKGLLGGAFVLLVGLTMILFVTMGWVAAGFGNLDPSDATRTVIAGRTLASLGGQTILFSLIFSYLGLDDEAGR